MILKLRTYFKNFLNSWFSFRFRAPLNKTFIFPNLYGFLFGGVAFVLLLMAMGYSNNLLYFFVFFLISIAVTGMWITNKNIDRIQLESFTTDSLYAEEDNKLFLRCQLKPTRLFPRLESFQIHMLCFDRQHLNQKPLQVDVVDEVMQIPLSFSPSKRGKLRLPRIELQSSFPFSMLRAWKYFQDDQEIIVYPKRKGSYQLPTVNDLSEAERNELLTDQQSQDHTGVFSHHREFQNNDPVYRIDWKRSAKFEKLFVKKFEDDRTQKQLLSWGTTDKLTTVEDKISQLALWVDICEKNQIEYMLLLPGQKTDFGIGSIHYRKCMEMLSLFEAAA